MWPYREMPVNEKVALHGFNFDSSDEIDC